MLLKIRNGMHVAISSVCDYMRNVTQIADNYMKYVNVAENWNGMYVAKFKCL